MGHDGSMGWSWKDSDQATVQEVLAFVEVWGDIHRGSNQHDHSCRRGIACEHLLIGWVIRFDLSLFGPLAFTTTNFDPLFRFTLLIHIKNFTQRSSKRHKRPKLLPVYAWEECWLVKRAIVHMLRSARVVWINLSFLACAWAFSDLMQSCRLHQKI